MKIHRIIFSFIVGCIAVGFFILHLTSGGEIGLSSLIFLPAFGTVVLIVIDYFKPNLNYIIQLLIVFLINFIYHWPYWTISLILAYVSFYVYLNIYKLFFDFAKLKWVYIVYINSFVAFIYLLVEHIYGSSTKNILVFVVLVSPIYLFIKSTYENKQGPKHVS